MFSGDIDTTYQTVQRDLFTSGLAAQIGPNAFAVWSAVKVHADFESGQAWPSIRKLADMTGLGSATVMRAIEALEQAHMLRKEARGWPRNPGKGTKGRTHTYVARERLDVRLGSRVLCTIVVDYLPFQVHKRLKEVKDALQAPYPKSPEEQKKLDDVWAQVDILPGPGFEWDPEAKKLSAKVHANELPEPKAPQPISGDHLAKLKATKEATKARLKQVVDGMSDGSAEIVALPAPRKPRR